MLTTRDRRGAAVLVGLGIGVAGVVLSLAQGSTPPQGPGLKTALIRYALPSLPHPCAGARDLSSAALEAATNGVARMPTRALDQLGPIRSSTLCPVSTDDGTSDQSFGVLEFASGIEIRQFPTQVANPAKKWAALAAEQPNAAVELIAGNAALVVTPDVDAGSVGAVEFVSGGRQIIVTGNGRVSRSTLVEIAEGLI